jgi:hypothetical protein
VPYEASQERRVNAIGVYFTHGPQAGRFDFETRAHLPKSRAKKPRKSAQEVAQAHGLSPEEVGTIDAARFLSFVWKVAGRLAHAPEDWKRERPLWVVLDNYSVHKSQPVQEALPELEAAEVHLFFLPSYTPELSKIEPVWNDTKYRQLTKRSYETAGELKRAVDNALQRKADLLQAAHSKTEPLLQQAA